MRLERSKSEPAHWAHQVAGSPSRAKNQLNLPLVGRGPYATLLFDESKFCEPINHVRPSCPVVRDVAKRSDFRGIEHGVLRMGMFNLCHYLHLQPAWKCPIQL